MTGKARAALRTIMLQEWTPDALTRLNRVLFEASDVPDRYCTVAVASIATRPLGGAEIVLTLRGHPHPIASSEPHEGIDEPHP